MPPPLALRPAVQFREEIFHVRGNLLPAAAWLASRMLLAELLVVVLLAPAPLDRPVLDRRAVRLRGDRQQPDDPGRANRVPRPLAGRAELVELVVGIAANGVGELPCLAEQLGQDTALSRLTLDRPVAV